MKNVRFAIWLVLGAILSNLLIAPAGAWAQTPRPAEIKLDTKELINVNRANLEELQQVKGVGPVLAERIVSYRDANGPFKSLDQLKEVKGIGEAKFEKMKGQITL